MFIKIKAMKRIEKDNQQIAIVLFEAAFHFLPRVGDIIHTSYCSPCEVLQVIIRNNDVVLEVKEYNNSEQILITNLSSM